MAIIFDEMTKNSGNFGDTAFEELDAELAVSRVLRWECTLPQGSTPAVTSLLIERVSDSEYYMSFSDQITYSGSDVSFRSLCRQQRMLFDSIDEMKHFLRNMHLEQDSQPVRTASAQMAARHDIPCTDRSRIVTDVERKRLKLNCNRLVNDLGSFVRGQDEAVQEIATWSMASVNKRHCNRPVSILLAGPTGVGKKLVGRSLAPAINMQASGEEERYGTIVVRCNELTADHMVARLTGAPAGYTGYGDKTLLSPVATNPYQIIIFDELEKASPAVLDVLMSAMDTGEVTLNKPVEGQNVLDLRRCILLFTSNIALEDKKGQSKLGFQSQLTLSSDEALPAWTRMRRYCDTLVRSGIRPEIAARFTSIIQFKSLTGDAVIDIVLLSVQNLADEYGFSLRDIAPEIVQQLYDRAGGLQYGARVINNISERFLGVCFAEQGGDDGVYDLVGTLDNPHLKAVIGTQDNDPIKEPKASSECTRRIEDTDNEDFPDWEHDV